MAQCQDVFGCGPSATDVIDLDRTVLRERRRVDEDDRHAGTPDLLDLWMVVGQADRDHAVDGGPAHRSRQRSVDGRDEVQPVAEFFRGEGDAFAELAEERIREDDAERLRREHADREGLALAEHARYRMWLVAELVGDFADACRGLRGEAIRRIECERHGRLGDTRLPGDVRDPRAIAP